MKRFRWDRAILVLILLLLSGYIITIIISDIIFKTKKYEFDNGYINGIATECGEVMIGKESCLVGNKFIPIKQYMEVK